MTGSWYILIVVYVTSKMTAHNTAFAIDAMWYNSMFVS